MVEKIIRGLKQAIAHARGEPTAQVREHVVRVDGPSDEGREAALQRLAKLDADLVMTETRAEIEGAIREARGLLQERDRYRKAYFAEVQKVARARAEGYEAGLARSEPVIDGAYAEGFRDGVEQAAQAFERIGESHWAKFVRALAQQPQDGSGEQGDDPFAAGISMARAARRWKGGELPQDVEQENKLEAYLIRQWEWSRRTFGEGGRTKGILAHIRKELEEIEREPTDLLEWADVIVLALDGFWRHGGKPEDVMRVLQVKQNKNFAREWPAPKSEDEPVEHVRARREEG